MVQPGFGLSAGWPVIASGWLRSNERQAGRGKARRMGGMAQNASRPVSGKEPKFPAIIKSFQSEEMIKKHVSSNPVGYACTIIDGIPYVKCSECSKPVKLTDALNQKIVKTSWKDEDEYITSYDLHHQAHIIQAVKIKRKPVFTSGHGCFDCHYQIMVVGR